MYAGKDGFSQLMDCLPWSTFTRLVARYRGDFWFKHCLAPNSTERWHLPNPRTGKACATLRCACRPAREALSYGLSWTGPPFDTGGCQSNPRLAHLRGIRPAVDRTGEAALSGESLSVDLKETVYALDSTTIDLCLSLFPWAHFRSTKAAVKMHTLLDLRGNIPNLNIGVSTDNWFIHSGSGTDAIAAHGGTNVLDGGTGSNFLTGGTGTDTFFVDDRAASADIWSTVVGFHAGDAATIWGVTPQDFSLAWADGQGAGGYTGLTLHATGAGKPTASLTLAGFTTGDLSSGRISVTFGNDPASGSSYMYAHCNS